MIPDQNASLSHEIFLNPPSAYRGITFWGLNAKLSPELLEEHLLCFKRMGLGGAVLMARTGCETPYLSEEFMRNIGHCVEVCRREGLLAILYDEDRWPSGYAGGLVTQRNPDHGEKHLLFTQTPYEEAEESSLPEITAVISSVRTGKGRFIACYDIELDAHGCLVSSKRIGVDESAAGVKWYVYLETALPAPWFNFQSYGDTLSKEAMDAFIDITYEAYKGIVGRDFGSVVPAMFTDEPQFSHKTKLAFAAEKKDVFLPWTTDFHESFKQSTGLDILAALPELFWQLPDGRYSAARYHYHDHVCHRFAEAFTANCAAWCRANKLPLTGHMMEEAALRSQTAAIGEAMRFYRDFDVPGIDMIFGHYEYTTAKQAQSAVHQYGTPGMMSELYGGCGFDFDFRMLKTYGDWQAALGVTLRVPHLSWLSMAGEGKRDCPPNINYQAPWHREYHFIEDHFARIGTALTRGKPSVRVGVIHPIESFWLEWGPDNATGERRKQLDKNFYDITEWLIFGLIDFDFICESLLPQQCETGGAPLQVGQMAYEAVVVPGAKTLRATTVERLERFTANGGLLICMGDSPSLMDAMPSPRVQSLYDSAVHVSFEKSALLDALSHLRDIDIKTEDGLRCEDLLYNLREENEDFWLFVSTGVKPSNIDVPSHKDIRIIIKGEFAPTLYDTLTGSIAPLHARYESGMTVIPNRFYNCDSLLMRLVPGRSEVANVINKEPSGEPMAIWGKVPVTLSEPNVLLLDIAEYAFDDGPFMPPEELLRADAAFRAHLGWPSRADNVAQPWAIPEEPLTHTMRLRFTISSKINTGNVMLALEDAERVGITLDGEKIAAIADGYFVDKAIKTVPLGKLRKGESVLELAIPFGKRTNVEWCYLLGDFGVAITGASAELREPVRELAFGDITSQGLPFYGDNVSYHIDCETKGGDLLVRATQYRGALIGVSLDGERCGSIILPPYNCVIPDVPAGRHRVSLELFGNRYNCFGAIHNCDPDTFWHYPMSWRTVGDRWCYNYMLKATGIITNPSIYL